MENDDRAPEPATSQEPLSGSGAPADDDAPVRGEVRLAGWKRISHGLFRRPKEGLDELQEFVRELEAWRLVLPPGARFTHVTGARLLGWDLPKLPEQVPVFAAVRDIDTRPRRPGLICSRLRRTEDKDGVTAGSDDDHQVRRFGLLIEAPEEILLRASRDLGLLDVVILIDSARHLHHIDDERMERLLASRRPGVRALRAAWDRSDARAESPGETALRVFHQVMGVAVEPQAEVRDSDGNLLATVDLLVVGTLLVHEYDGAVHRERKQHTVDLRRERGLAGTAYSRRGYTLDDLLNHAVVVMHEMDRSLGRGHSLRRLERWRALVADSMYSESGRRRVMNRWQRTMGHTSWPGTA